MVTELMPGPPRMTDAELDAAFAAAMARDTPPPLTEKQLQAAVLAECGRRQLRVFGVGRSDRAQIARLARTGRGWPDLTAGSLRTGRILFRELKTEAGDTRAEQDAWLWILHKSGADAGVWRPGDWESGRIQAELEALG